MSSRVDLVPFGFTPTESLVYEVLLTEGPGTGYTVARAAGLARANVYAALEGLVTKGAARVEEGRPKRFRPEPPSTLLARVADRQGEALDHLRHALESLSVPETPTLVELVSARGAVQLMGHEVARAEERVLLLAPPDGCLALVPHLRRVQGAGRALKVLSTGEVPVAGIEITVIPPPEWPGEPVLMVVDHRAALIGARRADHFTGHFGSGAAFVAAAERTIDALRGGR
ncbi:MAG: TrmB family transcriptional regulator [Gemmatimonadetes bacterium]|nr:TrmB family transcriptional regulator [Gemmatimonadota bacterium]MCB9505327.1 TrmB family transcriptional regulator [Gemmatimonadales bacterium]MCA9769059.1 TrmB family transcriptional regulator [Gemmatimonadota bacterium]MCB9518035.1 TrmB family transcriptional regulator [Gemmatimonadales bacterium]HPF60993.1 helix-turn-helix domain-containing protein [Gemmatimonadales bacterium]